MGEPYVVRTPATSFRSFTAIGSPASANWPWTAEARSSARSAQRVGSAFSGPSTASIRRSAASTSSRGETSPARSAETAARAERVVGSAGIAGEGTGGARRPPRLAPMFLDDPPQTPQASATYDAAREGEGYVANFARLWCWRPDLFKSFVDLRLALMGSTTLSDREQAIVVTSTVSQFG